MPISPSLSLWHDIILSCLASSSSIAIYYLTFLFPVPIIAVNIFFIIIMQRRGRNRYPHAHKIQIQPKTKTAGPEWMEEANAVNFSTLLFSKNIRSVCICCGIWVMCCDEVFIHFLISLECQWCSMLRHIRFLYRNSDKEACQRKEKILKV